MKRLVSSMILTACLGLCSAAYADASAPFSWTSTDSGHPVVIYKIQEAGSSSIVVVHLSSYLNTDSRGPGIMLTGCSGTNTVTLNPDENVECHVKSSAPLVATSLTNVAALGSVQFIAKGN